MGRQRAHCASVRRTRATDEAFNAASTQTCMLADSSHDVVWRHACQNRLLHVRYPELHHLANGSLKSTHLVPSVFVPTVVPVQSALTHICRYPIEAASELLAS
mmetsp:Transcript_56534/g.112406  ORF Transcript_56534/g.112406 Transcript_56534/m.112406 type:complete len:103 (-) Transcript_56534:1294-1602(-)